MTAAPEGFAEAAKHLTVKQICRAYNVGMTTARRWRLENGLVLETYNYKPMPDGFAQTAANMPVKAICHQWCVSKETAGRWRKEASFGRPSKMPALSSQQLQHLADTMTLKEAAAQYSISDRSMSKLYRAAGVIHKQKRSRRVVKLVPTVVRRPVYNALEQYAKDWIQTQEAISRCRQDGSYDHTGAYFHFRNRIWDGSSLVEKALDMGWKPELAWSVAA